MDECLEESVCKGKCLNTIGSYRCLCDSGYRQVDDKCIGKYAMNTNLG